MRVAKLRALVNEKLSLTVGTVMVTGVSDIAYIARGIKREDSVRIKALFPHNTAKLKRFLEEGPNPPYLTWCYADKNHGFGVDLYQMEAYDGSGTQHFCSECHADGQTCLNYTCGNRFQRDDDTGNTLLLRNGLCANCDASGHYVCGVCRGIFQDRGGRERGHCSNCRGAAAGLVVEGYHHTEVRQKLIEDEWTKQNKGRMLGFELEVECGNDSKRMAFMEAMKGHFGPVLRGFERDGSLSSFGVEMITQATGLRRLTDLAVSIPRVKGIKSHDTTTCGMHVHVSREGLTTSDEARIVGLFASSGMTEFLQGMARRPFNDYCRQIPRKTRVVDYCGAEPGYVTAMVSYYKVGTRGVAQRNRTGHFDHHAVDFSHAKTVEFRLFRGTLFGESIAACLEFSNAVVSFVRLGGNPLKNVAAEEFMAFVNSPSMAQDTKWLRKYVETNVPQNIAKARLAKPLPEGFVGPVINKKVMRNQACA